MNDEGGKNTFHVTGAEEWFIKSHMIASTEVLLVALVLTPPFQDEEEDDLDDDDDESAFAEDAEVEEAGEAEEAADPEEEAETNSVREDVKDELQVPHYIYY